MAAMSKRVDGIHYVLKRDGEAGSLSKAGNRAKRKPTDAELMAQWEACERSWAASLEIRGLKPLSLRERIHGGGEDGFSLKFQSVLLGEIEGRGAKASKPKRTRKASKPVTVAPSIPKRRERIGIGCAEEVTPRQWAAIASAALSVLGEPIPENKDVATDLVGRLMQAV